MHVLIRKAQRIAWRLLRLRLGFVKRIETISASSKELDDDITLPLMRGLMDVDELPEMKIMGCILNPLCQREEDVVDTKLCTWDQYEEGKELLIGRMTRYYEQKESNVSASITDQPVERTNRWSKIKHPASVGYWPSEMAAKELQ